MIFKIIPTLMRLPNGVGRYIFNIVYMLNIFTNLQKRLRPVVVLGLLLSISQGVWSYQQLILDDADYTGFYQFGPNNISGHLMLVAVGGKFYGQIQFYDYRAKHSVFVTLRDISIINGELSAKGVSAVFVLNDVYAKPHQGLLVKSCQLGDLSFNNVYGDKYNLDVGAFVKGKYPEASLRLLGEELKGYSSQQLRVMRNEIFARYGYRFTKGGEMDAYFNNQWWYLPRDIKLDELLTDIERQNIQTIRGYEQLIKTETSKKEAELLRRHDHIVSEIIRLKKALLTSQSSELDPFFDAESRNVVVSEKPIASKNEIIEDINELKQVFELMDLSLLKNKDWITIETERRGLSYINLSISDDKNSVTIHRKTSINFKDVSGGVLEIFDMWTFGINKDNRLIFVRKDRAG